MDRPHRPTAMVGPLMVTRLRTTDGRIVWMRRIDHGYPLALAMARQRLTLQDIADRTRELDPERKGISLQLVGRLVTQKASARETTTRRSAELLSKALGVDLDSAFSEQVAASVRTPRGSTQRRNEGDAA